VVTGLKKQGANNGAALSFMIATPESGIDSIAVSWAMLDPVMTIVRPVAGFITAVATGITENFFGRKEEPIDIEQQACQIKTSKPETSKPGNT
jgi:uncharacterized membrane protein YraQ (UPF0718 family)